MKKIFQNAINFLLMDVQSKTETKDLAVLIRITCILLSLYYLIVGIAIAFFQKYIMGIMLIAAIGMLIAAFICTYENRTFIGLVILNAVILIFSSALSFNVGYSLDFHVLTFLNILFVYFNKTENMMLKRFYATAICIYNMFFSQICDALGAPGLSDGLPTVLVRDMNIIILTGLVGTVAYSFCTKFNQAEDKLRKINDNLEQMANIDTLTGLSNRRHMNDYLSSLVYEYNKDARGRKTFTLAIGDVDFFKKVNDTYGHEVGDYVLSTLAKMFEEHMKGKGHVARWGGEEFLFCFENMDLNAAYLHLDALRHRIEITPFQFRDNIFNLSMSYGLEEFNSRLGVEATINRADEKLYKAKTSGRNRVVIQ